MNSLEERFNQMATDLRKEISDKNDLLQSRFDRQEKEMMDYQKFCDELERKEKLEARKRKINSILK